MYMQTFQTSSHDCLFYWKSTNEKSVRRQAETIFKCTFPILSLADFVYLPFGHSNSFRSLLTHKNIEHTHPPTHTHTKHNTYRSKDLKHHYRGWKNPSDKGTLCVLCDILCGFILNISGEKMKLDPKTEHFLINDIYFINTAFQTYTVMIAKGAPWTWRLIFFYFNYMECFLWNFSQKVKL